MFKVISFVKFIIFISGLIWFGYRAYIADAGSGGEFLWLFSAILWCFGWWVARWFKKVKEINALPLLSASVRVVSSLHEVEEFTNQVDENLFTTSTDHKYSIAFEFPDKSRKLFGVDAEQYALICEGDTGILSYKQLKNGKLLFVDFQRYA